MAEANRYRARITALGKTNRAVIAELSRRGVPVANEQSFSAALRAVKPQDHQIAIREHTDKLLTEWEEGRG